MITISLNLNNLKWNFFAKEKELITQYLNHDDSVISKLIILLAKTELTLYTEEDFNFYGLCELTYEPFLETDKLHELNIKVEDGSKLFSNFKIVNHEIVSFDNELIDNTDHIPCLVSIIGSTFSFFIVE